MKFLVIQTSFLGDVILATAIAEKLHSIYPHGAIDFLVKFGNESVLKNNPNIRNVLVWDKKHDKYGNLIKLIGIVRKHEYEYVINLHRFGSSGLLTMLSGAPFTSGFHNNPFSFSYTHKYHHSVGNGEHEIVRNQQLISFISDAQPALPAVYPSQLDFEATKKYKDSPFVCIAPGSVWATKRLPIEKWVELCDRTNLKIYTIGSSEESKLASEIISKSSNKFIVNLCGELTLLQTASLLKEAKMNYVNDSAPLHLCSAINAECTAFFCSTLPEFGFGPLGEKAIVVQTKEILECRPCGIHGRNTCPKGHFKCGETIQINDINSL